MRWRARRWVTAVHWQAAEILGRPERKLLVFETRGGNPVSVCAYSHPDDRWFRPSAEHDSVSLADRECSRVVRCGSSPHRYKMARLRAGADNDSPHGQIPAAQEHRRYGRISRHPDKRAVASFLLLRNTDLPSSLKATEFTPALLPLKNDRFLASPIRSAASIRPIAPIASASIIGFFKLPARIHPPLPPRGSDDVLRRVFLCQVPNFSGIAVCNRQSRLISVEGNGQERMLVSQVSHM